MANELIGLKLQVMRGVKTLECSKKILYKPADFSFELFSRFRRLSPELCAVRASSRFGTPSFILKGANGNQVKGWLIKALFTQEIVYLESWSFEPAFFIYTSGDETLIAHFIAWIGSESANLHLVKGGKI